MASYEQALRIEPDYVPARWNRALASLLLGNFEQGWVEYEWRWKRKQQPQRSFRQALWDGRELSGRTILLHAEQGLGDTLQFIRYAPLVKERGGRVIVECQPSLLELLGSCRGIDVLEAQGSALPEFDVQAPLLSLPRILGTSLATIPANVPYVVADAELVGRCRQELEAVPGFRIGIAWQGSTMHKRDRQRSLPLGRFEPLARLPGVRLLSLQVGAGADQLRDLGDRFPIADLGGRFDPWSLRDAAAVISVLDLVISVDSAMAHLAGALGVPIWLLLPFASDWRWLLEREDSPWYPTMRLFRQSEPGDWDGVFDRVTNALAKQLASTADGKR
jgi:hypothetical protein